jgi:hypothetical protein
LPQLKQGSVNLRTRIFLGGPMALREPALLKGIAAEVVAEDAPATVKWLTQHMPAASSRAS